MGNRVSHSVMDPILVPAVAPLYRALHIPARFPPEGIVAIGHGFALVGAAGFALSTTFWWAGLVGAAGVLLNHVADMVDGTHARATGQCRNGGELLDHFTDPLSFSAWMIGIGIAVGVATSPWIGLVGAMVCVLAIYATAVLVNIRAKIEGTFSLARFGPTEFKVLLAAFGVAIAIVAFGAPAAAVSVLTVGLMILAGVGVVQLITNLRRSVHAVNACGSEPDTSPWDIR